MPPIEGSVKLLAYAPEAARASEGEFGAGHLTDNVSVLSQKVEHRLPHRRPLRAALHLRVLVQEAMGDKRNTCH